MVQTRNILKLAEEKTMKEMKGIGDRLFGLEQLLCNAKKLVQEQSDLAQSILQVGWIFYFHRLFCFTPRKVLILDKFPHLNRIQPLFI